MERFKQHKSGYFVSNYGRVKGKRKPFLKPSDSNGYYVVSINGKQKKVHRLVVETFISEISKGYCVNHIDGDKKNNFLENLEIVTFKENTIHAYKNGLAKGSQGQENSMSKLMTHEVIHIYDLIKLGKTNGEIALIYNLHERYISLIRHGKRWSKLHKQYFNNIVPISRGNTGLEMSFMLKVIREIIKGNKTLSKIAKQFDLDPSTVSRIKNKKTWKCAWGVYESNVTTIENPNQLEIPF